MSFIEQIKAEITARELKDDLVAYRQGGLTFSHEPNVPLSMETPAQDREFASGVFLSTARSGIRLGERQYSGYHIEFVFESFKNAQEFCDLLAVYEILPKLTERKNTVVIYIKDSDCICNLLALVGATKCMMALSNEIAARAVRNQTNRRVNCDTHNIEKQISASRKQVEIITKLLESGCLTDPKLRDVAKARLANPDASYEELAKTLGITKSGLVHRLRRITNDNPD
jgi:DNA-binding protein WhiA